MPALPNQDCGRSASSWSSRAIFTKARNGWAARSTATWRGTLASKRSLTRQAPALVEASWSAYFRLSKNVRCIGPASSSEASPLTCWPPRDASAKCAFVNAAISASVDDRRLFEESRLRHSTRRGPAGDRTRAAVLINQNRALSSLDAFSSREPVSTSLENASERCPAAKLELLHAVVRTLGERHRVVEAQRTERRRPDQADTHRRADQIAVVEHQIQCRFRRG